MNTIETTVMFGQEEQEALMGISMASAQGKKARRRLTVYCALMALVFGVLSRLDGDIFWGIAAVIILAFGLISPGIIQKGVLKHAYKKADPRMIGGERFYRIDDSGIMVRSPVSNGTTDWKGFSERGEYSHYIWIMRMDRQVVLVDKNKLTQEEMDTLQKYLQAVPEA